LGAGDPGFESLHPDYPSPKLRIASAAIIAGLLAEAFAKAKA